MDPMQRLGKGWAKVRQQDSDRKIWEDGKAEKQDYMESFMKASNRAITLQCRRGPTAKSPVAVSLAMQCCPAHAQSCSCLNWLEAHLGFLG